jgi:hypothetical protein
MKDIKNNTSLSQRFYNFYKAVMTFLQTWVSYNPQQQANKDHKNSPPPKTGDIFRKNKNLTDSLKKSLGEMGNELKKDSASPAPKKQ